MPSHHSLHSTVKIMRGRSRCVKTPACRKVSMVPGKFVRIWTVKTRWKPNDQKERGLLPNGTYCWQFLFGHMLTYNESWNICPFIQPDLIFSQKYTRTRSFQRTTDKRRKLKIKTGSNEEVKDVVLILCIVKDSPSPFEHFLKNLRRTGSDPYMTQISAVN